MESESQSWSWLYRHLLKVTNWFHLTRSCQPMGSGFQGQILKPHLGIHKECGDQLMMAAMSTAMGSWALPAPQFSFLSSSHSFILQRRLKLKENKWLRQSHPVADVVSVSDFLMPNLAIFLLRKLSAVKYFTNVRMPYHLSIGLCFPESQSLQSSWLAPWTKDSCLWKPSELPNDKTCWV